MASLHTHKKTVRRTKQVLQNTCDPPSAREKRFGITRWPQLLLMSHHPLFGIDLWMELLRPCCYDVTLAISSGCADPTEKPFCVSPSSSSLPPEKAAGDTSGITYCVVRRSAMDQSCHQKPFWQHHLSFFNCSYKYFGMCWCCMPDVGENVLNAVCFPSSCPGQWGGTWHSGCAFCTVWSRICFRLLFLGEMQADVWMRKEKKFGILMNFKLDCIFHFPSVSVL